MGSSAVTTPPWQSFETPELAFPQMICRTFLIASAEPTKLGRESLVALGWTSLLHDGVRKLTEVPSKFKVLRARGLFFVSVCLFFKANPFGVGFFPFPL